MKRTNMPLDPIPDNNEKESESHSLIFYMLDRSTNQKIEVVVDGIALEDIADQEGRDHTDLKSLFASYRSRIEDIASNKYDHEDWDGHRIMIDASDT